VVAVNDVSVTVRRGEIFGLLGPNGAGKSTLINCCLGIVPMGTGKIEIFGHDIQSDYVNARKRVGFVYQEIALDSFFTARRTLLFHRGFYGRSLDQSKVKHLMKDLGLWEHRNKYPDHLSGGLKRRLALAQALVHEPDLVFLDEPTAGIDIELRDKTWEIIRSMNQRGTTILLTTHYIEEAELMCDRIGIISHGKFLKIDTTQNLLNQISQRKMTVYLRTALTPSHVSDLSRVFPVREKKIDGLFLYMLSLDKGYDSIKSCLEWFHERRIEVHDVELKSAKLEDVFRKTAWGESSS
jgi:ABC-2 type transport system ATP-binding protein